MFIPNPSDRSGLTVTWFMDPLFGACASFDGLHGCVSCHVVE